MNKRKNSAYVEPIAPRVKNAKKFGFLPNFFLIAVNFSFKF